VSAPRSGVQLPTAPKVDASSLPHRARVQLEALRTAEAWGPDECHAALRRLASWLDQTAYELAASGADQALHGPMKMLAEEIRSAVLSFDELWRRAVELLEALAAGPGAAPGARAAAGPRRAFWKRG
jgi:hypothetical protein